LLFVTTAKKDVVVVRRPQPCRGVERGHADGFLRQAHGVELAPRELRPECSGTSARVRNYNNFYKLHLKAKA
jgi:hypothetical protein